MRLSHNLASLNIYYEQNKNLKLQSTAMSRISSGVKLNSSSENPNQIANSEKLRMQIRGMQMAQRNIQDGSSLLQTAEGGLDNATSILQRIKELSVQAGGLNGKDDLEVIQKQIGQMVGGLDDIMNNTDFNGMKLLADPNVTDNTSPTSIEMLVGSNAGEVTNIPKYNLTSNFLGDITTAPADVVSSIDVTAPGGVNRALNIVDKSLSTILSVRSKYGAIENRFESTYNLSTNISGDLEKSESGIRDADIADEMINYTKSQLLVDVGNALMVQTNRMPQEILKILDNVK
jgi:flagellin